MNEMLKGVVPSQVIAPARSFAKLLPQLSVQVTFLEPFRIAISRRGRKRLRELVRLWPEGRISICPYIGRLGNFAPSLSLFLFTCTFRRKGEPLLFYCRGPEATIQAAKVAKCANGRVIFDARGASDHEASLRVSLKGSRKDEIDRAFDHGLLQDKAAAEVADFILAVSPQLLRKLETLIDNKKKPSAVIPCCVERLLFSQLSRDRVRRRMSIQMEELLLVHTSTQARWEAFDQVLEFFRYIQSRRPARLLFLTTLSRDFVVRTLRADDPLHDRIIVQKASSEDMEEYLSAADIGLILRPPHATHQYASPIKFSEYLGAGLSIAASEGIGIIGHLVQDRRLGVTVPSLPDGIALRTAADNLLAQLDNACSETTRQRSIQACRDFYLWENYIQTISSFVASHNVWDHRPSHLQR